jgi:WD40 repeat protein
MARLRVSLLTLLILVLFIGAAMGFSQVLFQRQFSPLVRLGDNLQGMGFSSDDKKIYVRDGAENAVIYDTDMQLLDKRVFKCEGVGFLSNDEKLFYVVKFGRQGMTHILDLKTNQTFTIPGAANWHGVSALPPGNGGIIVTLTDRTKLHGYRVPSTTEIWQTTMDDVVNFELENSDATRHYVNHDKGSEIIDLATGARLVKFEGSAAKMQVFDASWSPDKKKIVTACPDSTVNIWDAESGKQLFVCKGHKGFVMAAQFSADGTKAVSVDDADNAIVWDVASGKEIKRFAPFYPSTQIRTRTVDSTSIVMFYNEGIRLWDMKTLEEQRWAAALNTKVLRTTHDLSQVLVYNPDHTLELLGRDADGKFSWSRFIPVDVKTRVIQFSAVAAVLIVALIWSIRRDRRRVG